LILVQEAPVWSQGRNWVWLVLQFLKREYSSDQSFAKQVPTQALVHEALGS
jgi:hypothetical protein